ncbi:MAG: hypothetical protein V8R43_04055 [Dorea sp.]
MEWKEFEATFPIQLNEQQKEAVQSTEGPVLLLAVPGSGRLPYWLHVWDI